MKRKCNIKPIIFWLFIIYSIVMLIMLFGRDRSDPHLPYLEQLQYNINIVPFRTIKQYFMLLEHNYLVSNALINLLGNVAVFIPLGLFLPYLWNTFNSFPRFLLICITIILAIEVLQLFTLLGSLDIDDLILNILGIVIGYAILKTIKAMRKHYKI